MNPLTLTVMADGTVCCLWTELLPLAEFGHLQIQRATAIEFDNESQTWSVFSAMGECLHSHPSRQECLRWEQEYFNQQRET